MRMRFQSWFGPMRAFVATNVAIGLLTGLTLLPSPASATAVTDNFNRADGALGANWTTVAGTNSPTIASNQLAVGISGAVNAAFWSANTFAADQYAQGQFTTPPVSGQYGPGIAVRLSNSGTGYFLWYGNADNTVSLFRMDSSSSWTSLYQSNPLTIATTDTWRIEAVGAFISAYQNGNLVGQVKDSHYTSGSPGVWFYDAPNTIDNWAGGDTAPNYSLGGTVSGLNGTVVLQNNGASNLTLSNNGVFAFNAALPDASSYNVTVATQPAGQTCTVQNGSGNLNGGDVTTIAVTCTGTPPTVTSSDNFNHADGALGPNWSDFSDGGLAISSGVVAGTVPAANAGDIRTAETYPADQYSQIDIGTVTGGDWIGPTVRTSAAGQDLYLGLYTYNSGSPYIEIFKRTGSTWNNISAPYNCGTLAPGTQLKLEVVGEAFSLLVNGVELVTATDNTDSTGAPGVMTYGTPTADNWAGGSQGFEVHYLSTDANGVKTYDVLSPMNNYGPQLIKVLEPSNPAPGIAHNLIYSLPVTAGADTSYGDGLATLQALDAQNQYNLTIIEPLFGLTPWYADNPNDPGARQESYMTSEVVPWANANFKTTGTEQSWLLGFSKSGIGAMDLFLKHPDLFDLVGAWDWPADSSSYSDFGAPSIASYGTDANFQANYRLTQQFIQAHKAPLMAHNRIWLGSYAAFAGDVADFDIALTGFAIPHTTETPTSRVHEWQSGWVPDALTALEADSQALIPPSPSPTPTPTATPTPTPAPTPVPSHTPVAQVARHAASAPVAPTPPAPSATPNPTATPSPSPSPSATPEAARPQATPLPDTTTPATSGGLGLTAIAWGVGILVVLATVAVGFMFIRARISRPPTP